MELRQLTTFRAVADALSFTRAAEALNYAQSSVTAQVAALESELGVPLFERLGKRIALTEAGERLVVYAERLLRLAEEAKSVAVSGDEPAGPLIVGAPESLCTYRLPPILRRMRQRFPKVQVIFKPGICTDLRHTLGAGQIDVALVMEEWQRAPGLVLEPLLPEPMRILAHPTHPLAGTPHVLPTDLAGEPLLLPETGCSYRVMFERALADAGVRPGLSTEFASVEALKQCIMGGLGLAILPQVAVSAEIEQGKLAALDWAGPEFAVVTQLAWHKDKWLSPAMQAFIALVKATLAPEKSTA